MSNAVESIGSRGDGELGGEQHLGNFRLFSTLQGLCAIKD